MNFNEPCPKNPKQIITKAVVVVRFTDNVHFDADQERMEAKIKEMFREGDQSNILKGHGEFIDPATGVSQSERFAFFFKGFFRNYFEGKILVPAGISGKDYDKYQQKKPYLLSFYYDTLELHDDLEPVG